jgi:hypothetical protein
LAWIALGANATEFIASLTTFFGDIYDKSFKGLDAQGKTVPLVWRQSYVWLALWSATWGITGIQKFLMQNVFGIALPPIYQTVQTWGYIGSGAIGLIIDIIALATGLSFNNNLASGLGMTNNSTFLNLCLSTNSGCF